MPYTKLFSDIVTSSLWCEDDHTRLLWVTMLALADKEGQVMGSPPGLARMANIPVDACRAALDKLASPDPDSRSQVAEGRRIAPVRGGYEIINHEDYRKRASKEDSIEQGRERQRRHYERNKAGGSKSKSPKSTLTVPNGNLTVSNAPITQSRDIAEAEAEAEAKEAAANSTNSLPPLTLTPDSAPPHSRQPDRFDEFWEGVPNKIAKLKAQEAWAKAMKAGVSPDTIIAGLEGYRTYEQRRSRQGDYRPLLPASWLNGGRWEDELPPEAKPSKGDHRAEQRAKEFTETINIKKLEI